MLVNQTLGAGLSVPWGGGGSQSDHSGEDAPQCYGGRNEGRGLCSLCERLRCTAAKQIRAEGRLQQKGRQWGPCAAQELGSSQNSLKPGAAGAPGAHGGARSPAPLEPGRMERQGAHVGGEPKAWAG